MQSTTTITGTFTIEDWQENTLHELTNDGKITSANVKQSYQGDLSGSSELSYQMHYHSDGNADFIGFEVINAEYGGKACELTLKHQGKFENGQAKSEFTLIQSTPETSWQGARGSFCSTHGGQAEYQLNLP